MTPYEIRLIINRKDGICTARWIDSGGQESAEFTLSLPLGQDEATELRWYLEEYYQFPGAGDYVKAEAIEKKLKVWGRALFEAVFGTGEAREVYRNLMQAEAEGQPGMITLGSTDPEVLMQPWEMMRDTKGVLALRGVTLRRQLQGAKLLAKYNFGLPLRILMIVSRPSDVGFIDPRNSLPPVLEACEALGGLAEVDFCTPPTLPRLEQMISQARKAKQPYHIVHFDGHGTYLPLTGVGALVFEDKQANTDLVTGQRFGDLMARQDVPLVLLEACRGADLSDRPVFGSLAPALLDSGVGSVVAFSHSVHIQAARILVERFYQELVSGQSVGAALQEARAALLADPQRFLHLGPEAETVKLQDWFIPQLYQVGSDPVLIPPEAERPQGQMGAAAVRPALTSFPPEPMYRFHGRALELLELERAFRQHNAVVVSGMGGMGKTALAREAAAWWLRTGLFERAVFTSFEQKAGATNAILLLGRALEGDDFSRRSGDETDPQGQRQTAVRLFHENPVLLVWDNFESTLPIYQNAPLPLGEGSGVRSETDITAFSPAERLDLQALYRQLTEGKPKGRLLVTCRPQEAGLAGIKEYPLEGLKRPDSLHLLAAALDVKGIRTDRPGYERHAIAQLLSLLDDHPLSIELIAPHLKTLTPAQVCTDFAQLLEHFTNPEAPEYRNRGLLASLDFSRTHLSPAAQQTLPWLAWFEGGVFERFLLDFAGLQPEAWEGLRSELEATALLKVEVLDWIKSPYLRFHPTLRYAARPEQVPDPPAAESLFIQVYLAVDKIADQALRGQQPGLGMRLVALEEANLRRAMQLAFASGLRGEGQALAETLRLYLERAGRNRERDALVAWVHAQLPADVLDAAACNAIQEHAWVLCTQGQAGEAVQMLQDLLERLQSEGLAGGEDPAFQIAQVYVYLGRIYYHDGCPDQAGEALHMLQDLLARLQSEGLAGGNDPAFQIALAYRNLARIYVNAGRPDLALEPLQQAITCFEQIDGEVVRTNLGAALVDLANAYRHLGKLDDALRASERALVIGQELKLTRNMAGSLDQIASILFDMHRYPEAEKRYAEALQAAQAAGDWELQGATLQGQGLLQRELGRFTGAVELFKQAIAVFQRSNNSSEEMHTCDLIGTAERDHGELESAEAWYGRARQIAEKRNDRRQLAATAQNLGILYQRRAEAAADPQARQAWLAEAIASIRESLAINLADQNQVYAAGSYFQLGILHRLCGELAAAQENLLQALAIAEPLNHPNLVMVYANLAEIARLRGEQAAAAEWQAKRDAKRAELECLERGEGGGGQVDEQLVKFILQLAQLCYQVRVNKTSLPPEAAEALAQLCAAPAPLSEVGASLQATAAGEALPPLPEGLPPAIAGILQALQEALEG